MTGEYAVVFGEPGIAVPSSLGIRVQYKEDLRRSDLTIDWKGVQGGEEWTTYLQEIVERCRQHLMAFCGTLTIENNLPLGKGMGSSTSLVIAVARCLLGENCRKEALEIEDAVTPRHSGLDFAVIWNEHPLLFRRDHAPEAITLPKGILRNAILIDTGTPNETTPELIAWIEGRKGELKTAFDAIGRCTEHLIAGRELKALLREHHAAQVQLGIVPRNVRALVEEIERRGGSAKITGAGGRTGGGGMLLAVHDDRGELLRAVPANLPVLPL